MPLHPLSMGQAQKVGIVCSLGPGLGLTPALNTVCPSVPSSSPFPCTQTPLQCNTRVSLSPALENCNGSTLQNDLSPSCATKPGVGRSSFARVPHSPAYLSATGHGVRTRQAACSHTEVWISSAKKTLNKHRCFPAAQVRIDNPRFKICVPCIYHQAAADSLHKRSSHTSPCPQRTRST